VEKKYMNEIKYNFLVELFDKEGVSKEKFADMVINLFESCYDKPLSPYAFELAMSLLYKKYKFGEIETKNM
jgi:hypothetical protein